MELRWCLNTDPAFLALTTALDKHLREQQGQAQGQQKTETDGRPARPPGVG